MPLFESQKSRNQRLFRGRLLALSERLSEMTERDEDYKTHSAWLFGGSIAGCLAVTTDGSHLLKKAWGKGNEDKAYGLIEVFTLPMISRWYRTLDRQMDVPPAQREEARRIAASSISDLFGHSSEQFVDAFMGMDIQFNYERDRMEDEGRSGTTIAGAYLLLSKALTACGYPSRLDWSKLKFPVESFAELAGQAGGRGGLDSPNLNGLMAIMVAPNAGERAMYDDFRAQ